MALTIEIFNRRSGKKNKPTQTYFRIKAGNGEIIAQSEGYNRERDCLDTVKRLQEDLFRAEVVMKTETVLRSERREGA